MHHFRPYPMPRPAAMLVKVPGLDLERLTQRSEMADADDAARQRKHCDMNVDAALRANAQPAGGCQPGMYTLDSPT